MSALPSVLFFGRRSVLSVRTLESIAASFKVVGIVESHFKGFKHESWIERLIKPIPRENDIRRYALEKFVPYFLLTPDKIQDLESFIQTLKPDIGLIASLAQLLPPRIIALFPGHILNVHPSFLPEYRGPNPYFWIYYHEEKLSGVTVHYIDKGEDTGDIVCQERLPTLFGEPWPAFVERTAELAAKLAVKALNDIAQGSAERVPQKHLPTPFRARMLGLHENPVDWDNWPIERVFHVLRGAGYLDLIPNRPFPLSLFKWRIAGFEKFPTQSTGATFKRIGTGFYIMLRSGRIRLTPEISIEQAIQSTKRSLRPLAHYLRTRSLFSRA